MIAFLCRRRLEAADFDASRIDAAHHVLDRPALAGRVERLKNQQHPPIVLGVELLLELPEPGHAFGKRRLGARLVSLDPSGVARVDVLQAKFPALGDDVGLDELADA